MEIKTRWAQDRSGNVLPFAQVSLYYQGTNDLVSGLEDKDGSPLSNPFQSDVNGKVVFAAPDGQYDIEFNAGPRESRASIQFLDVSGALQVVENIDTLRSITGNNGRDYMLVKFHTSEGDGGGGDFYWADGESPGTYVDNGGTIIVPTGWDGSAAWVREFSGKVNIKWFGAKGDGVADDTAAIQAALNFVSANQYRKVYAPAGHYKHGRLFTHTAAGVGYTAHGRITICGDGIPSVIMMRASTFTKGTVFEYTGSTEDGVELSTNANQSQNIVLEDILFTGNTSGYILRGDYVPSIRLKRAAITNKHVSGGGASFGQCWFAMLDEAWVENTSPTGENTGVGILLSNQAISGGIFVIRGASAVWNFGTNIKLDALNWQSVRIADSESGGAKVSGLDISKTLGVLEIDHGYFEANYQDITSNSTIRSLKIGTVYILGGGTTSGNPHPRMAFTGEVMGASIETIYAFRSFSNLLEVSGTAQGTVVDIKGVTMIHDDIGDLNKTISTIADNGSGGIRVTVTGHNYITGRKVRIANVVGTTEANGEWEITVIDPDTFDLNGSVFTNAYVSGGNSFLLCFVFKSLGNTTANIKSPVITNGNAELDTTSAYRVIDGTDFTYLSRTGFRPNYLASDIEELTATGTNLGFSTDFKYRRYTTTADTNLDIFTPVITAAGVDGRFGFVENRPESTHRLNLRLSHATGTVVAHLVPGEMAMVWYDRANRTNLVRKLQPTNARSVLYRTAPPTTGAFIIGDTVHNRTPAAGQPIGWICVAGGSPGTWEVLGQAGVETSIAGTPLFVGQIAVAAGVGYMATGTASSADWKQITA